MTIPCFSDNSTSDATTPTTSTGAPPPTDTPPIPYTVTSHTGDISSIPSTLTTPTSNTDVTFSNPTPPSSPSVSSTVSQASSHSYYSASTNKYTNFIMHAIPAGFTLRIRVWHGQSPQGMYIHTYSILNTI